MENKSEKKKRKIINTTTIGMAQDKLIQKNGEAAGQIIQAYKGVRYDSFGNKLSYKGRSLKKIKSYKINKNYRKQNIKQQSGFSAELIKEARDNKEAIKTGNLNRTTTTDGIGKTNDQKYDHYRVDQNGNKVQGSGSQMKFLKIDEKGRASVVDKMVNDKKWDKYDTVIDIPEDQYDDAIKYADAKAAKLREQADKLKEKGNLEKSKEIQDKADKYEDSKKRLRKSNVKEGEAIEARLNPEKFVTKEIIKDSHTSGVEAAKGALIFSGSIACAQNIYCVLYEEKSIDEAIVDVVKTTSKAGVTAYTIGATGTAINSVMHTSKNELTRKISTTSAPAMIATGAVEISKSIKRYVNEEIDEVELLEELGEKGTGMVAAGFGTTMGSLVGTAILPGAGTLVGGFVGGMISYTVSSILYKSTLDAFEGAKISAERRIIIEELSRQSIKEMKSYQETLTEYANSQLQRREEVFISLFDGISTSIFNNDIDGFIANINGIGQEFRIEMEFKSFKEFEETMEDESFTLIL